MSPLLEPAILVMTLTAAAGSGSLSLTSRVAGQHKNLSACIVSGAASPVEIPHSWQHFLMTLASPGGRLSPVRARQVQDLWEDLEGRVVNVTPPYAAVTDEGGVSMTWDQGRHHFEIEVLADGLYDWFYMDRESNVRAGEDGLRLGFYSPELVSYLQQTAEGTWRS